MNAVIYARVSTKDQEENGYSLDAQKDLLLKYAIERGLNVVKVISVSESASGKKIRKEFNDMLEFVCNNNIPVIICEKTDRLTRNPRDASTIDEWVRADASRQVHFVKESSVIHQGIKAHEALVWDMKVSISRYYTNNLSEEVRKGNAEKIKQGRLPGTSKIGYKSIIDPSTGRKIHVPDNNVAPHIENMFNMYVSGDYSLTRLTNELYMAGFRSKTGRRVPKSNIARYLSDPFYHGYFTWNGQMHKGTHEPLISKETFDRAQLIKSGKTAPRFRKHLYLLKGKVHCSVCSGQVTWESHKGIVYGHCNKCKDSNRSWYREDYFVDKITRTLSGLVLKNERFAEWLKKALKEYGRNETEYRERETGSIKSSIDKIEQKLSRLYEDRLEDRIDIEFYDKKSSELKIERETLTYRLTAHAKVSDKTKELGLALFELSQNAPTIFKKKGLEEKRDLLTLVFSDLTVVDGDLNMTYTPTFEVLRRAVEVTNGSKIIDNLRSPIQIFEPLENGSSEPSLISLRTLCPEVLPVRDSNPNDFLQREASYH